MHGLRLILCDANACIPVNDNGCRAITRCASYSNEVQQRQLAEPPQLDRSMLLKLAPMPHAVLSPAVREEAVMPAVRDRLEGAMIGVAEYRWSLPPIRSAASNGHEVP